jgi:hypothetical protein
MYSPKFPLKLKDIKEVINLPRLKSTWSQSEHNSNNQSYEKASLHCVLKKRPMDSASISASTVLVGMLQ